MGYRGKQNRGIETPSQKDLEIIIAGDDVASARLTNQWGKNLGTALQRDLATAQIRAIFGKVRQIEMNWGIDENADASRRDLILLKPKLKYQAARKKEVKDLAELLSNAIDLVDRDDNIDTRIKFQRFVDFFEAILAYHKAAGGK
jgi:CRISPR-associated protein Csm2